MPIPVEVTEITKRLGLDKRPVINDFGSNIKKTKSQFLLKLELEELSSLKTRLLKKVKKLETTFVIPKRKNAFSTKILTITGAKISKTYHISLALM